jgi:hypothetical protein
MKQALRRTRMFVYALAPVFALFGPIVLMGKRW